MCSNTSLGSGCNGQNGDTVAHHGRVLSSKKPKRPRVPKRGPGVAELEKILREQENNNDEGFPLSFSKPDQLSAPDLESFGPSKIGIAGDNGTGKKNVLIGGTQIVLPEHTLLPTTWDSGEYRTSPVDVPRSFPVPNQWFPSIMHVFSHSDASSSATTSAATGIRDSSTEPPSNQAPYPRFNSFWKDENKMIVTKRLRPYSMDVPDVPAFRFAVPTLPHNTKRIDSSLPYLVNVHPSDDVSRNLKMDCSSEPISRKHNSEYEEETVGSQKERFNFSHMPFQDMKEKKPLDSLFYKKDQTSFNLNVAANDEEEDAIDLNLKL